MSPPAPLSSERRAARANIRSILGDLTGLRGIDAALRVELGRAIDLISIEDPEVGHFKLLAEVAVISDSCAGQIGDVPDWTVQLSLLADELAHEPTDPVEDRANVRRLAVALAGRALALVTKLDGLEP